MVILTYECVPDYKLLVDLAGMVDADPDRVLVPVVRSPEAECNIAAVAVGDILLSGSVNMFAVLAVVGIGAVRLVLA